MKKKIGVLLAALLLLLPSVVPVHAEPDRNTVTEAVSGYCLGDELYAFFRLDDGYDVESMKVSVKSDDVTTKGEGELVPITESSSIVRYVFMIDRTGSMRKYVEEVNAFVDALTAEEQQEAVFTVATFGERFEVVKEKLTDKNAVTKTLSELDYTEQLTDPYTGVESALTYLDSYSRRSGDVINLVVITDGDPDLGEESEDKEKGLAQSAADKIANTPEVIVSTLCTAEWDEDAYKVFSASKGIHERIDSNQDAAAAGKKMAQYVDSLYQSSFKLAQTPTVERFSMELQLQGSNSEGQLALLTTSLSSVPNLKMFSNEAPEEEQDEKPKLVEPEDTDSETEENSSEGEADEKQNTEEVPSQDTESVTVPSTEEGGSAKGGFHPFLALIPIACVVIVAIICLTILMKRKYPDEEKTRGQAPAAGAIAMKLEVYAGTCVNRASTLYLTDVLTIGSAPGCGLIFQDPDVAPVNSRIFVRNQMIYIEDLNSKEGTALGGMRIQGQNRLRSGDVISIGSVEFSLKF